MTDGELLSFAPETLTAAAQGALKIEMERRALKFAREDQAELIQPGPSPNRPLPDRPVGGWLAFLCWYMILGPICGLVLSGLGNRALDPSYFREFPRLYPLIVVHAVISAVLMTFLFFAGLGLWQKWNHAVPIAKVSLAALLIYSLAIPLYPFFGDLPIELRDMLVRSFAKALLPASVWLLGCLLYLMKSRRVRETFPRAT